MKYKSFNLVIESLIFSSPQRRGHSFKRQQDSFNLVIESLIFSSEQYGEPEFLAYLSFNLVSESLIFSSKNFHWRRTF